MKFLLTFSLAVLCSGSVQADEKSEVPEDVLEYYEQVENKDVLDNLEVKMYPVKYYKPKKLEAETTVESKMEGEEWNNDIKPCQAEISIGYLQFVTRARIDATIENNECAASRGQYEILLQIIDENGKLQSVKHIESWALDNDTLFKSRKFYNIGDNAELFRTTTRGLTCRCTPERTE